MYRKWRIVFFFLFCCYGSTVLAQKKQKIGDNPFIIDKSAVSEIQSTTGGFLPPRLTTAQRDAIVAPATGLVVFNSDINCLEWYNGTFWYNGCGNIKAAGTAIVTDYSCAKGSTGLLNVGTSATGVTQTITATVTTVGTYSISAVANGVTFTGSSTFVATGVQDIVLTASGTPIAAGTFNFTLNTIPSCTFSRAMYIAAVTALCDGTTPTAVVPITSSTGRTWMDRNLGASRAATYLDDYKAYGCLYQWGRGNDGHASMTWATATEGIPVNGVTTTQSATTSPGHALFIIGAANWLSISNNDLWQGYYGINNPCPTGYYVPSVFELLDEVYKYNITDVGTAYNSPFKFTRGGYRKVDGDMFFVGVAGVYYTSSSYLNDATVVAFGSGMEPYNELKVTGHSVRCIKN